ncbi:ROK family protein, partial [Candidatus Saccharibacteria bacterium]|nr:ROK family protein [Candidatus Saccharibacteria bacterium]
MFLSIDIGGTKTLLALFSFRSLCLKRLKFPTPKSPEAFLKTLTSSLESFLSEKSRARLKAVTIAVPGRIKFEQNFCSISCPNLPWGEFDLLTPLRNFFSCTLFFANDANLATLYESSRKKAGKTVYLTFSTGIGGGLAKNSHLLKSESPELIIIGGPLGFISNRLKRPLLTALKSSVKLQRASRPTESVIYG